MMGLAELTGKLPPTSDTYAISAGSFWINISASGKQLDLGKSVVYGDAEPISIDILGSGEHRMWVSQPWGQFRLISRAWVSARSEKVSHFCRYCGDIMLD